MEWIRSFKEKQQSSRQSNIQMQAMEDIRLSDFDDNIYIAFHGTPLISVETSWTTKEILEMLQKTRNSYVNFRMKQLDYHKPIV